MAEHTFYVSRSIEVAATPDQIHTLLDDFHEWQKWSPWEGLDPQMSRTYSGPSSGVGATYEWQGNRKAGRGRMEILDSQANHVTIDLEFAAPMKAHNRIDFTLAPVGPKTHIEWAMTGPQNLVMRLMSKVWSMEKMIGPDFEKGLAKLKAAAETQ